MFFQTHPRHGKQIQYMEAQARACEKNGWKTVSEEEFYAKPKTEERKKPGPKPKTEAVPSE